MNPRQDLGTQAVPHEQRSLLCPNLRFSLVLFGLLFSPRPCYTATTCTSFQMGAQRGTQRSQVRCLGPVQHSRWPADAPGQCGHCSPRPLSQLEITPGTKQSPMAGPFSKRGNGEPDRESGWPKAAEQASNRAGAATRAQATTTTLGVRAPCQHWPHPETARLKLGEA